MRLSENQTLFYGRVIDSNDPKKLGRIRAKLDPAELNLIYRIPEDKLDNKTLDIQEKYKWTNEDPFVFLPLLPFFNKVTPKEKEFVHILFGNKNYPQQNKFYIPGPLSDPTSVRFQNFEDSKTYLSDGVNYKEQPSIPTESSDGATKTDSYGVIPKNEDISIMGRGTSDIVVKENSIIIRAGKSTEIQRGQLPIANNRRSFLELDYFSSQKETDKRIQKRLIQETKIKLVKFLIEYNIYNHENNEGKFNGDI